MALFGFRKKPGDVKEAKDVLKELEKEEKILGNEPSSEGPVPEPEKEEQQKHEAKPEVSPLFVRVTKYKQILRTMNFLKTTIAAVRSSISILGELDNLREENLKMVEEAVNKMEARVRELDSGFMRPSGFVDEAPELQSTEGVEVTIDDLKMQINQLKAQIETLA